MAQRGSGLMGNDPAWRVQGTDRRRKAVNLRLEGLRWDQVAEACGYADGKTALMAVRDLLEEARAELSDVVSEYRIIEIARLEEIIRAHWDQATSGEDLKAAELVLKVIDRLARVTGTAQPVQVDVSGGVTYEVVGWTPPGVTPAAARPELEP